MFRFEELDIWKLSVKYAEMIYKIANRLPAAERYNIVEQLKRAALSISNNIAEGSGTSTTKNFKSFLDISISSALETVNMLIFGVRMGYISEAEKDICYQEAEVIIKKIRAFKNSLK